MDPYKLIATYYDCEHEDFHDDIELYLSLIEAGPVLEIGAGTGRVSLPLVKSGLEVWCVDPSAAMLERARERLTGYADAHRIQASVLDLTVDRRFAVALLTLNTLWHLTSLESQLRALQIVRRHLLDGATLIVDLSNPLTMADRRTSGEVRQRFSRACNGTWVSGFSAAWDDQAEQLLALSLWYDEMGSDNVLRRTRTQLSLRYIYRPELELMLRSAGFDPDRFLGSYDQEPYTALSPNLIALATAT